MCQKGAAGAKEAKIDRPWKEASLAALHSFPFCTSAQYPQGCFWLTRRGIRKQLQRPREKTAKLMTSAAARWLRTWHKGPPCRFGLPHLCTSCEFFKLYESRPVMALENKASISAVCQSCYLFCQYTRDHSNDPSSLCLGEQEARNAKALPSYSQRPRRGICCSSYWHLPNTTWGGVQKVNRWRLL